MISKVLQDDKLPKSKQMFLVYSLSFLRALSWNYVRGPEITYKIFCRTHTATESKGGDDSIWMKEEWSIGEVKTRIMLKML